MIEDQLSTRVEQEIPIISDDITRNNLKDYMNFLNIIQDKYAFTERNLKNAKMSLNVLKTKKFPCILMNYGIKSF